jgi:hypothetical protein
MLLLKQGDPDSTSVENYRPPLGLSHHGSKAAQAVKPVFARRSHFPERIIKKLI